MNLICGINPVLEALGAHTRHFDRLLVAKGIRNRRVSEVVARASRRGIPLRFETRETLDRMAGGVPHQGVIAVVSPKPVLGLVDVLDRCHEPALLVALDGVEDPRNLGAVLRTAEAAGVDGVLLPERHSAGLSETVARASAGGLEHVAVARVGNLVQALETLKARGIWVVGFDAAGTERWDEVDLRRPVALVFGGEGRGIRRLVREHCDHLASIPLFGHVGSLNVSVAAGVAIYEALRQRGAVPTRVHPIPERMEEPPGEVVGPGPDDVEEDPGRLGPPSVDGAGEPFGDEERGGEEGEDERPDGISAIHEETAWGGPEMVQRKRTRTLRPHATPRRKKRWGRPRPGTAPAPPAGGDRPRDGAGDAPRDRGPHPAEAPDRGPRRRRRKPRRGRPPAGTPGGPGAGAAAGPAPAPSGPGAALPPAPGGGGAPQGGEGRRRRRRRRH